MRDRRAGRKRKRRQSKRSTLTMEELFAEVDNRRKPRDRRRDRRKTANR